MPWPSPLARFLAATFLWLPFWFALWYQLAPLLTLPVAWGSELALNTLHPGLIGGHEGAGQGLSFVTRLAVDVPDAPAGAVAELVVAVNPLIYSWNLPVLMALLFAANQPQTFLRALVALAGLLPMHIWGVSLDVLKRLALQSSPELHAQIGYSGWELEAIALGYQFGYLMLPVIGAATLWIALNRPFIARLLEDDRAPRERA